MGLLMPPYNIDDIQKGYKQKVTFFFKKRKLQQMQKQFAGNKQVVIFTDGACANNPGLAGASACFFAKEIPLRRLQQRNKSFSNSFNASDNSSDFSDYSSLSGDDNNLSDDGDDDQMRDGVFMESNQDEMNKEELKFICTSQINIGFSTNNMAEYTGVILALLICALNRVEHIQIRADSELLIKQIKGIN